jgi:hypothetical protein
MDPLANFPVHKIGILMEPLKFLPTWGNNMVGSEGISKRLDRFLLVEKY